MLVFACEIIYHQLRKFESEFVDHIFVLRSRNKKLRSRSMSIYILIGLSIYAMIILFPLIMSFETKEIILFEKMTGPNRVTRMKIEKVLSYSISRLIFDLFSAQFARSHQQLSQRSRSSNLSSVSFFLLVSSLSSTRDY